MVCGQNGTERNQFLRERPHQEKYKLQKQKTQTGFLRHKLMEFSLKEFIHTIINLINLNTTLDEIKRTTTIPSSFG